MTRAPCSRNRAAQSGPGTLMAMVTMRTSWRGRRIAQRYENGAARSPVLESARFPHNRVCWPRLRGLHYLSISVEAVGGVLSGPAFRTQEGTVRVRCLTLTVAAIVSCASMAFAQEALLTGLVSDETKATLPGVTVTATQVDTGRVITAVSDERGEYRLRGLPAGRYQL